MRLVRGLNRVALCAVMVAGASLGAACSSSAGSPRVDDAIPRQVDPAQRTFVLIEGDHFARGAVARIGSSPLGAVTWVNGQVLTAEVPPGLPPGSYDLTVDNPGGGATTLAQAIVVGAGARPAQPAPAPSAPATRPPANTSATAPPSATRPATSPPTEPARTAVPARTEPPTRPPTRPPTQPPTQSPPAQATQAPERPAATPNVAGTWSFVDTIAYGPGTGGSFPFQVTIQQSGSQLSGGGSGLRFTGAIAGNTIHLDYVQENGPTGTFDWTLSPDGNSFTGSFTNSSGNGGGSSGQRLGGGEVSMVTYQIAPHAPPPVAHGKQKGRGAAAAQR